MRKRGRRHEAKLDLEVSCESEHGVDKVLVAGSDMSGRREGYQTTVSKRRWTQVSPSPSLRACLPVLSGLS